MVLDRCPINLTSGSYLLAIRLGCHCFGTFCENWQALQTDSNDQTRQSSETFEKQEYCRVSVYAKDENQLRYGETDVLLRILHLLLPYIGLHVYLFGHFGPRLKLVDEGPILLLHGQAELVYHVALFHRDDDIDGRLW